MPACDRHTEKMYEKVKNYRADRGAYAFVRERIGGHFAFAALDNCLQ